MKVFCIFGTPSEAIKLAPVIWELDADPAFDTQVCATGQEPEMLQSMIELFGLRVHYEMTIAHRSASQEALLRRAMKAISVSIGQAKPDIVIVQGHSITALAGALAAFYAGASIAHIEAGLRTDDLSAPWPEEANRQLVSRLAAYHFAPTRHAAANLLRENIPRERIVVTGATVIDTLQAMCEWLNEDEMLAAQAREPFEIALKNPYRKLVLVAGHKRETSDGAFGRVFQAIRRIAGRADVEIVFPVHPNRRVQYAAQQALADLPNVHMIAPLGYLSFVALMREASLIITDSGAVQEEAPTLGVPVLVTRAISERAAGVETGMVHLIGPDEERLVQAANSTLDDIISSQFRQGDSPYGDGHASRRIVAALSQKAVPEFVGSAVA